MFDETTDVQALIEELGTPTKVAVTLANGYVSSQPPGTAPESDDPGAEASEASAPESGDAPPAETEAYPETSDEETAAGEEPGQTSDGAEAAEEAEAETEAEERSEPEAEQVPAEEATQTGEEIPAPEEVPAEEEPAQGEETEPEDVPPSAEVAAPAVADDAYAQETPAPGAEEKTIPAAPEQRQGANGFVRLLYWLFAILIGIPVTVFLIAIGIPFLAGGVWLIWTVIRIVPGAFAGFTLLSDILLLAGTGLVLLAVGLLLAWFGLWLSITLCRIWIGKVLLALGNRVTRGSARSE